MDGAKLVTDTLGNRKIVVGRRPDWVEGGLKIPLDRSGMRIQAVVGA